MQVKPSKSQLCYMSVAESAGSFFATEWAMGHVKQNKQDGGSKGEISPKFAEYGHSAYQSVDHHRQRNDRWYGLSSEYAPRS